MQTFADSYLDSTEFFQNPYPVYAAWQATESVRWSHLWNAWIVTQYDDALAIMRDTATFSSAGRQARLLGQLSPDDQAELMPLRQHYESGGIINTDPPLHTRLRKLINAAFTPRVVKQMRERVQVLVDALLDTTAGADEIEIIHEFAYPLPAIVIAELLGVPPEDREQFKYWSERINAFLGTGRPDADFARTSQASILEMKGYLRGLLAERVAAPQVDLLSQLALVEVDGDSLREEELLATCVTLLNAGHETTTNLIGNGLLALLRHASQMVRLREHPAMLPEAIEELLRYDGPIHSLKRVATRRVKVGETDIEEGALLYLMLGAVNRDPMHFAAPHQLQIEGRSADERPIPFGYGIHYCIGAPLARLEGEIALAALLRRYPTLELAAEPQWKRNMSVRGVEALCVRRGKRHA